MTTLPDRLGRTVPIVAAPMAGGAGRPRLVIAVARASGMGFLAGGYQTPGALAADIRATARETARFGVNLFAPRPVPIDAAAFDAYRRRIADDTGPLPAGGPVQDDDGWDAKIALLREHPVPVVSFTFGIPGAADLARLRRTGALLLQTVTTAAEAAAAADAGLDALVVQAPAAGAHSGTFDPARPLPPVPLPDLVAEIRHAVPLPIIATGGVAGPADVTSAVRAGADAVAVGTILLLSPDAGTTATHRAALADPRRTGTVLTRAFTGRPARALPNGFIERHDAYAPLGYPALHHLTRPMRAAASAAGDADRVHLWAGTGFRSATSEPAGVIVERLAGRL